MEIKKIAIIGGGISGLALLHFLSKKYGSKAEITLIEKTAKTGGTIDSAELGGCLFETGPNGFLNNQPATLELVHDLGLDSHLVNASFSSKLRYMRLGNRLHVFPKHPIELLAFGGFSFRDKLRVFAEPFVPKGGSATESMHDFCQRRFGVAAANTVFDCVAHGIYGGNSRQLNMREAFGMIAEMEEKYGSVTKGLIVQQSKNRPQLMSFQKGMGELVDALTERYAASIRLSQNVTDLNEIQADIIFLSVPAHAAAGILHNSVSVLAGYLEKIHYVPITVAGLVYRKADFTSPPKGYGYLAPSTEGILGVLFESNVFPGRSDKDHVMVRVMMRQDDLSKAHQAVADVFPVKNGSVHSTLISWPKAIPQYDQQYAALKPKITQELFLHPRLRLAANYWKGVSFNDCIKNARDAANSL